MNQRFEWRILYAVRHIRPVTMIDPANESKRSKIKSATAIFNCLIVSPCSCSKTKSSLASSRRGLSVYSANAAAGFGSTEKSDNISLSNSYDLLITLLPPHPTKTSK